MGIYTGEDSSQTIDRNPEVALAKALKDDLNVDINPQALRMFIRTRFLRISKLAHMIHEA